MNEYAEHNGIKVDLQDADLLTTLYRWMVSKGYAVSTIEPRVLLHKRIAQRMGLGDRIQHKNRDKLDNRRSNLRTITYSRSMMRLRGRSDSISGVVGVHSRGSRWRAQIMVDGKRIALGSFASFADAVAARQVGEARYFDSEFVQ